MRIRNRKINPTMVELIYGILAYGIVVLILMTVLEPSFGIIEKVVDFCAENGISFDNSSDIKE